MAMHSSQTAQDFANRQIMNNQPIPSPKYKKNHGQYQRVRPNTVQGYYNQKTSRTQQDSMKTPKLASTTQDYFFQENSTMRQAMEFNRIMPQAKNIKDDKEKLFENILHQRQVINIMKEENNKLKTRNLNLEREAAKFEKIIEDNANKGREKQQLNSTSEQVIMVRLKKQLKELQKSYDEKKEEVEGFKRNCRITKIQELNWEIQSLNEELKRLRDKLMRSMKINIEFTNYVQTHPDEDLTSIYINQVNYLKKDNLEMAALITEQETELNKRNQLVKDAQRQVDLSQKEKIFNKKQMIDLENNNKRLADMTSPFNKNKQYSNVPNKQLENAIEQQKQDLEQKDQRFQELYSDFRRQEKQLEESKNLYTYEKRITKEAMSKIADFEKKVKQQEVSIKQLVVERDDLKRENSGQDIKKQLTGDENLIQENEEVQEQKNQGSPTVMKLPKVNSYDIEEICRNLKYRLKNKKPAIDHEQIPKHLFTTAMNDSGKASVREIVEVVKGDPFNISSNEEAELLARYLIEDNNIDPIIFDLDQTQDIRVIQDGFKVIIGKYENLTEQESVQIHGELSKVLSAQHSNISEYIKQIQQKSKPPRPGHCHLEEFQKVLQQCDINLDAKKAEYLTTKLYERTTLLELINLKELFDIFDIEKFNKDNSVKQNEETKDVQ